MNSSAERYKKDQKSGQISNFTFPNKNSEKLLPLLEEIVSSSKLIENFKNHDKSYNRCSKEKKEAIERLLCIVSNDCKITLNNLNAIIKIGLPDQSIDTDLSIKEMSFIKRKNEKSSQSIEAQYAAIQK